MYEPNSPHPPVRLFLVKEDPGGVSQCERCKSINHRTEECDSKSRAGAIANFLGIDLRTGSSLTPEVRDGSSLVPNGTVDQIDANFYLRMRPS